MRTDKAFSKIIRGCKSNKRLAQKELYELYYAYVMSICLHYSTDRNEAKDMANESFIKLFTNIKKYKETAPFKPWLRRIVVNVAIDYIRKYHKKQTTGLEVIHLQIQDTELTGFDKLAMDDILAVIQQLTPMYRTIFNLYVMEGYSHKEIAEKLDINIAASKTSLSRAKNKLREMLMRNKKKQNNG